MKLTPKGMRDMKPEDMYVREEVLEKIRQIFRNYGFRPLETPALEYLDTLRAKAGEEVDRQIFVIDGNEYGLRFDLTVPLARYAATTDDPKPFKRYAIDAVWRKEEPQRGRFREFYQSDADIVGSSSMRCEAELLSLARDICIAFGFDRPKIMVNNRKILDGIAVQLGIENNKEAVFRILDKLDKIGEAEVDKQLRQLLGPKTEGLLEIIRAKGSNKEKLELAARFSPEGSDEINQIADLCDFDIEVDLFLVRGLGYYTGPVFEIKLSDGIGTVIAGGRYDDLLGLYGQPAPAVGISVGIERLVTLIEERSKDFKKTETQLFIAAVKPEFYGYAQSVASKFRSSGILCETDLNERNLKKQLDYANSLKIPFVGVVGMKEQSGKKITLRNMASGEEKMISISDAVKTIRGE